MDIFASNDLKHSFNILRQMLSVLQTTSLYEIGLDRGNWFMLCLGITILFIVDLIHERKQSVFYLISQQTIWFRWTLYLGLIWCVIMFGIYGVGYDASQFIYFQF